MGPTAGYAPVSRPRIADSEGVGDVVDDWNPLSRRIGFPHANRLSIVGDAALPDSWPNQSTRAYVMSPPIETSSTHDGSARQTLSYGSVWCRSSTSRSAGRPTATDPRCSESPATPAATEVTMATRSAAEIGWHSSASWRRATFISPRRLVDPDGSQSAPSATAIPEARAAPASVVDP